MTKSKRILSLLLALVMVFSVACGSPQGQTKAPEKQAGENKDAKAAETEGSEVKTLSIPGPTDLQTMDYLVTSKNKDHLWNANFVDGLLEHDRTGKLVGALAESWEVSEDGLTWTFKLRPGVKWVTNTEQEYADVVAEDFVSGLRHAAEYKSGTSWVVAGIIKGFEEYMNSDFSDAAWEKVGVKAVDASTVQYTLEKEAPYFGDITTYSILFPVNKDFLASKGAPLGKPDTTGSTFGSTQPDSILYNGGYILSSFDDKSSIKIVKNNKYWDAEHVYLDEITEIYDEGSDPYSSKKGYENGTYSSMSMKPTWQDYAQIRSQYEQFVRPNLPNPTVYGMTFTFNRQVFENSAYASDEKLKENTRKAVLNENFRKAVRAAHDRQPELEIDAPAEIAKSAKRNINNFAEAAKTKDGKNYYELVNEIYNKQTGENVNLADGEDPFFGKEKAMEYIKKAEAEGIQFPVHLDMLVVETSDRLTKQANSMKNSIFQNTDGKIIVELVMRSSDEVSSLAFDNQDPEAVDFDISTFSGWSPDYNDPKSFAETFSPKMGTFMTNLGLGTLDDKGEMLHKDLKEKLGLLEYQKLIEEADKETKDLDKRYELYAKADALLIEKALYIPKSMQARGELVSKVVPFTRSYSQVGLSMNKYKGMKIQSEPVTTEQYNKALADWEKAVKESATK